MVRSAQCSAFPYPFDIHLPLSSRMVMNVCPQAWANNRGKATQAQLQMQNWTKDCIEMLSSETEYFCFLPWWHQKAVKVCRTHVSRLSLKKVQAGSSFPLRAASSHLILLLSAFPVVVLKMLFLFPFFPSIWLLNKPLR